MSVIDGQLRPLPGETVSTQLWFLNVLSASEVIVTVAMRVLLLPPPLLLEQLEKCAQDLGSTSKAVGSSMAQLLTCAAQGNEHYTGEGNLCQAHRGKCSRVRKLDAEPNDFTCAPWWFPLPKSVSVMRIPGADCNEIGKHCLAKRGGWRRKATAASLVQSPLPLTEAPPAPPPPSPPDTPPDWARSRISGEERWRQIERRFF